MTEYMLSKGIAVNNHVLFFIASLILDNACCFVINSTFSDSGTLLLCLGRTLLMPLLLYCASVYGKLDYHLESPSGKDLKLVSVNDGEEASDEAEQRAKNLADKYKNTALGILYAFVSFSMLFAGFKCVVHTFESDSAFGIQQIAMTGLILALNGELFLCSHVVLYYHRGAPHLLPQVHPHSLYYDQSFASYIRCNGCNSSMESAYSCTPCSFYLCESCLKRDPDGLEGMMRNDKGIVESKAFSYRDYLIMCFGFMKHELPLVYVAIACIVISGTVNMLVPNLQGDIMDCIAKVDIQEFHRVSIMFVIVRVAVGLVHGIDTYCLELLSKKMLLAAKTTLFQTILQQDIAFFDGMSSSRTTSMLFYGIDQMFEPVNGLLSRIITQSVLVVGGLIMCVNISWKLTVLAFSVMGPVTFFSTMSAEYNNVGSEKAWDLRSKANEIFGSALDNIKTVRAFSQFPIIEQQYIKARNDGLKIEQKVARHSALTQLIMGNIEQAIVILILWYGGSLVLGSATLSIGSLVKFQLYWSLFKSNFDCVVGSSYSFTKSLGSAALFMRILACKPAIETTGGEQCTSISNITIKNVSFVYQMSPSRVVLQGLNLEIKKGQIVALVGKSGSGKTTIINLLQRFYDPTEGTILLNGADLKSFNSASYRSHISTVAQDTQLQGDTFYDSITLYNKGYTIEQVIEAAKQANAHDFIMASPMGYDTKVGESGSRISGGQRQRIALARAFLRQPSLLLLDEATSSLDAESETLVQEAIDKLIAGRMCTVVLVAHRLSTVVGADLIAVVENGSIVERGKHSELMASGGIYANMVEKQIRKFRNIIVEEEDE